MMNIVKLFGRAVMAAAPALLRDAIGISGAGMIAYGAILIYQPAGWIVGGIILVGGAWLSAKAK